MAKEGKKYFDFYVMVLEESVVKESFKGEESLHYIKLYKISQLKHYSLVVK
jgi:hypothetical protein